MKDSGSGHFGRWLAAAAVLWLWMTPASWSQNLVGNPDFDTDLMDWAPSGWPGSVTWNAADFVGSPSSGSAELTASHPLAGGLQYLGRCVAVSGGASYDLGARFFIPSGQAIAGTANLQVQWHTDATCTAFFSNQSFGAVTTLDAWRHSGATGVVAPASAQGVIVFLNITKTDAGGSFVARGDGVYLRIAGSAPNLLTVHNTNDGGPGSLRDLLEQAASDGVPTTIQFAPSLAGQTIAPLSQLPSITEPNTMIDGDLGGDCDPDIAIDGSAAGAFSHGLNVPNDATLVRGLAIHSFDGTGVWISGNDNVIECNYLGTDLTQAPGMGNSNGVVASHDASDNRIGPANAVRHNDIFGVWIAEGYQPLYPEFTALTADHTAVFPTIDFTDGCGNFHRVGDSDILDGSNRPFTENFGMKLTGTVTVTSAGDYTFTFPSVDDLVRLNVDGGAAELDWPGGGTPPPTVVSLTGTHDIRVDFLEGGGGALLQMLVSGPGIAALSSGASPPAGCSAAQPGLCGELYQLRSSAQRNTITENGIGDNGSLGIAFNCCCGPTPNDPGDLDVGSNGLLNTPVIASVTSAGGGLYTVAGTAPPNSTVEIFVAAVDPSGFGEGNSFSGSGPADGSGNFAVSVPLGVGPTVLTSTATDALGNTSEFSANFATGGSADALSLGSASGLPATTIDVPIYVRDLSLTPLGIDRPAGQRIQRMNFTVTASPAAGIANLVISRAGIAGGLTPITESSTGSLPTETYVVTYAEASNLIPFTLDAAAPGDQVAKLSVTLAASAPAGLVTVTFTGAAANLRNEAGTTIEDEGNATLVTASGSFTVTSNAAQGLFAAALSSSLVALTWTDPNQNETGFRLERSVDGTIWAPVATPLANDTSYLDAGLAPATLYYYRLVTRVGASDSHVSNVATASTFPAIAAKVCRQRLGTGWEAAYNVALTSAGGGQWAATWLDSEPGVEDRVMFRRLDANGGPLGAPLQLSSPGIPGRQPTLAWNGSRFGALWLDHKRAADGTLPYSFSFALLDASGNVLRPHAVTTSAAPFGTNVLEPVMLWDGSGWGIFGSQAADPPSEVVYYRLDADGDLALGPVAVTDDPDWDSDWSAAWNGTVYGVAWVRHRDTVYDIYFQTMSSNGTLVGSPVEIRDHVAGTTAAQTSVVWNGSGWAVAWTQEDAVEGPVFLRLLDAAGNPTGAAQRISDLLDPFYPPQDDIKVQDNFPHLLLKPGGGYVIYTSSTILADSSSEIGRLEADAAGNKVGQRTILSNQDGISDYTVDAAADGTNFLVAWEHEESTYEVVARKLDPNGGQLASSTLTSGHDTAFDTQPVAAVSLQGGFAALWSHWEAGVQELHAKLFDAAGNLAATKTPLVAGEIAGGRGVVSVGNTFAVAWLDAGAGRPRFQRFDALGNALIAAVEVAPSGGGSPQIDWSGEVYGVAFAQNGLKFQRLAPDGTLVGPQTAINAPNFSAGQGARVRWVGSGWALLWLRNSDQNLYYARLDAAGNVLVPPVAITSTGPTDVQGPRRFQMVWSGQLLGVAWDENRGIDPPGRDLYFTVLDVAGVKQFPEIAVGSGDTSFDSNPALYWDVNRFKLVSSLESGMREIEILSDGTVTPNTRFLGSHEGQPTVAWDGAALGLARAHQHDVEFETDECLADATPPPCPTLTAAFHANRVALSWSAVTDAQSGLQSYNVYRNGLFLGDFTPQTLAYDDGGFVFGQSQVYEVRAFNRALGESTSCAAITVPTFANAAVALVASAESSTQILLAWTDPGSNETGFRIERSLDGATWNPVTTVGPNAVSHLDGGLSAATLYYYRVVTLVGGLDSQISNVATAVTHAAIAAKVCFDALVGDDRSAARNPSVAWDGAGWTVAWAGRETGMAQDDVFLRRFDASTLAPLAAQVQASALFGTSSRPELVSNGEYLGLSWVEGVGNPPGQAPESNVFFSLFTADGTPLRRNVLVARARLDHPFSSQLQPELAWDGTHWGHFSIEHTGATPGLSDLVYRRLDWNGDVVLTASTTAPSDHLSDAVAAFNIAAGKYGVAWIQIEDTNLEVYFQRMEEATGVFEGAPILLQTFSDFIGSYGLDVIADGAGWAVAWTEARVLIDESSPVWLARLDGAGNVLSNLRLSDALLPPDGFPFDGANRLFQRPAGGYAVLFDGVSTTTSRAEGLRLQADAAGARTGTRDLLTADDNFNSNRLDAAANGTDFMLAWNETATGAPELGGRRIDANGGAMGPVVALTTGHTVGGAGNFQTAPLASGFVVLWTDSISGQNLLQARIYDGTGAVVATLSPLSPTAVAGRPALLALGSTFAVAFRRSGVNETRLARFDAAGAAVVAETVVSTNAGGGETALAWSGEEYAVVWRRGNAQLMELQRVSASGVPLGPTVEFAGASANGAPQAHWLGSAWAILWRGPDNSIRYARLSREGAVEIAQTAVFTSVQNEQPVAFHSLFTGAHLGLAWSDRDDQDPPIHDLLFTRLQLDGTPAFAPVTVVSSPGFDVAPMLSWDGTAFRLFHNKGDQAGIREIGIQTNGAVLPGEGIRGLGSPVGVASNGATLGIVLGSVFETSACLADPTPPPCPAVTATFDGDAVHLTWPAVSEPESGPPMFTVLRDGTRLLHAGENATGVDDFGFVAGATHSYEVRARNRAFQESAGCAPIQVEAFYSDIAGADPYRSFILELFEAGVTHGCASSPLRFCADGAVTREQMAIFLLRAMEGPHYAPPDCASPSFADVPCSSPFAPWIEEINARGVITTCNDGTDYCPRDVVTREQMAIYVLRAFEGGAYEPPDCTNPPTYGDVPCSGDFAGWIEELAQRGVTSGCGGGNYCPANAVTREQMAKFIGGTFTLTFP